MLKHPSRENYEYAIPTTKGVVILRFKQATAKETFEYFQLIEKLMSDDEHEAVKYYLELKRYYVSFFVEAMGKTRFFELKKRYMQYLVLKNINNYIEEVMDLVHKTWASVYEGLPSPSVKGQGVRKSVFQSDREAIYKMTGIPVNKVYDVLTLEQVGRYIDRYTYEVYETFDEGRKINDRITVGRQRLSAQDLADLEFIKKKGPSAQG